MSKKLENSFLLVLYDHNVFDFPRDASYFIINTPVPKTIFMAMINAAKNTFANEGNYDWNYETLLDKVKKSTSYKIDIRCVDSHLIVLDI